MMEIIFYNIIKLKEETIMQKEEDEVLHYLQLGIFKECFQEYSLKTLYGRDIEEKKP